CRRRYRKLPTDIAGLDLRQDVQSFRMCKIFTDPIDELMPPLLEFLRRHIHLLQLVHKSFLMSFTEIALRGCFLRIVTRRPTGPHICGSVGPNNAIVGQPKYAARCVIPESLPMKTRHERSSSATDWSVKPSRRGRLV